MESMTDILDKLKEKFGRYEALKKLPLRDSIINVNTWYATHEDIFLTISGVVDVLINKNGVVKYTNGSRIAHYYDRNGNACVMVRKGGGKKSYRVVDLLYRAFYGANTSKQAITICYRDRNKKNFKLCNLYRCSSIQELIEIHYNGFKHIRGTQYCMNEYGAIYNFYTDTPQSISAGNDGYSKVRLSVNGDHILYSLHELVAEYFVPKPKKLLNHYKEADLTVVHINNHKRNNKASNLKWVVKAHKGGMPVCVKQVVDTTPEEYGSIHELSLAINVPEDTIENHLMGETGIPIYQLYQVKYKSDKTPWKKVKLVKGTDTNNSFKEHWFIGITSSRFPKLAAAHHTRDTKAIISKKLSHCDTTPTDNGWIWEYQDR